MLPDSFRFDLQHQRLWLLPQKAIYWQKRKTLLVADLHMGKSGHFRKNGIPVPDQVAQSNLGKLDTLLKQTSPENLIILGDLFHSDINNEWQRFIAWRKQYRQLEVNLIIGNHDILETKNYHSGIINVFNKLTIHPFLLIHDINDFKSTEESSSYILSGHIHPAVQLKGRARQTMKLPCFYFGQRYGILPAFGGFTGTHIIEPAENDQVFMIVESKVISGRQFNT